MLTRFAEWVTIPDDTGELKLGVAIQGQPPTRSVRWPVVGRSAEGRIVVGATQIGESRQDCLVTRSDDGRQWSEPQPLEVGAGPTNVSLGALSALASGCWVLAGCRWEEKQGTIERIGQQPQGINRYRWSGFDVRREAFVRLSEDGVSWSPAALDVGPFVAAAPCGRVIESGGHAYLPVYGPTSTRQKDAALSDIGLLVSENGGESWRFSSYIARGDEKEGIGWGASDLAALPDGRWVAMLEGNYRSLGDFARPRICRAESRDGGRTWSKPEHQLLGRAPTLVSLGGAKITVGTWYEAGLVYNVSSDVGQSWDYQGLAWDCIWYATFPRGGFRLISLDADTLLGVFHWGSRADINVSEIKTLRMGRKK